MSSPIEIANAYIALRVKMPGVRKDIATALGDASAAGDTTGRSLGDRLVSSATKVVKAGAATLGATIAAVAGTALVKGFQRLDAIDTARAKLTGLGHDAGTVETIMQNALTSVRGTAFGLGDAATVAAQAVAAGIKPGKDLEKVLGTVANTAAAAGTDLGEMGSIFSKAMSQANGIQNDVLSQLADKGIPIYQALADQLGVTAGEVFKLASSGKINFDQFAAAATAAAGTVASEMGNTVGGSFKNFIASLGRTGAGLLSGIFPQVATALQAVTAAMAPLEDVASGLGEKIGAVLAPAMEWFIGALQGGVDLSFFGELWAMLSPVSILFQAMQPILPVVMQAFHDIASAIGGALVPVLPALGDLLKAVVPLLTTAIITALPITVTLIEALAGAISVLAPIILDVVRGIVEFVSANADWLSGLGVAGGIIAGVIGAVTLFKSVQLGLVAATYGAQGAMLVAGGSAKVYAAAMGVVTGAQKIAAAATWLFNAALRANPIGIIITAITALVGGLIWFFTQTELGKAIWEEFTRFLGEAWANITGFFTAAYENVIKPVFTAISDIAIWLYETILKPVFDGIGAIVGFLAAGFKLQFDLIVNAFRLVAAIAGWLWVNALQPAFAAIGEFAGWLYETAIKPAFDGIGATFNWLYVNVVKPVFDGISALFTWIWTSIIKPYLDQIGLGLNILGGVFNWLYLNVVKPAWDGISQVMKTAWSWIETNVFAPFNAGIGLLGKAFDDTAKAIGIAWDGIKVAAAAPINFVLGTVWNDGLRSFWNDLVGNLGLSDMKLPKAELVKFANGTENHVAQIAGPGAMRLWAEPETGGEAYIPLSPSKRGRSSAILADVANRFGMTLLPFKNGGIWGDMANFAGDVWDNIASAASVAGEFLSNPAAAIQKHVIDGIIKPLIGDGNMLMRAVGQLPINLVKNLAKSFAGASAGGTAGMGWQAMWDIVKANVPGAVMTSGYRSPSGNAAVGGAKGSYHMQGRAIDLVPASMAMFNAVARLFPNATELIYTPAGDRQLRNGKPFNGWSAGVRAQHYSHVHLAMANGGVIPKLYDQGGWIPHGGMAVNLSGKPEAVLDPAQSAALRDGRFGGIQDGDELVLVIEGTPLTAIAKRVVSSAFPTAGAVTSQFAR